MRWRIFILLLIVPLHPTLAQEFQELLYDGYPLDAKLVAQNPTTGEIAVALENNPVVIWNPQTKEIMREFADVHNQWESLTYSPDGRFLAGAHTGGNTVLYDAATGAALHTESVAAGEVKLAFSPDSGDLLINGQWILDTTTYALTGLENAPSTCVGTAGTYLPGSDTLITMGSEVCLWSASSHTFTKTSDSSFQGNLKDIVASPTGDSVVVTTRYTPPDALILNPDGTVRLEVALQDNSSGTGQIDFADDGSFFVVTGGISAYSGTTAYVVASATGQTIAEFDSSSFQLTAGGVIYGSAIAEPDQLVLAHGSSGLGFFDLSDAKAQAQTLQAQAQERETQAAVDQALEAAEEAQAQAEAERLEAEQQAQAAEAARQQALADARAAEAEQQALDKIFVAAREGTADELAAALGEVADADLNVTDESGQTPLMIAAGSNEPLTVRFLVNLGADVNAQTAQGWTALMYAAQDNTLEMVETLVELGADVSLTNAEGNSASDVAADDAIRSYLDQQSQPAQAPQVDSEAASTPTNPEASAELTSDERRLFELARDGSVVEIIDLLDRLSPETFGANPELLAKTNEDGMTPLMIAASSNEPNVVLTLGAQGQNYNQKTADGWTALMYAAQNSRLDNIEALMTWNLNVLTENNDGDTVFDVAAPDIREALIARFPGAVRELQARQAAQEPPQGSAAGRSSAQNGEKTQARPRWRATWLNAENMQARYFTDLLEYAVVEEIDCPRIEIVELVARETSTYICFRDVDNVSFSDDLDQFVAERSENVLGTIGWMEDASGFLFNAISLSNGFTATIFESDDFVFLAGAQVP